MRIIFLFAAMTCVAAELPPALKKARDSQDRPALDRIAGAAGSSAQARPDSADQQYQAALAELVRAEVAMEQRDKNAARAAAESGIGAARRAIALKPNSGEYHRVLGALCGQVIPANVIAGLKYGRCALDEVTKALELEPNSAAALLSRGVGNYYLPGSFGGGAELALQDIEKSLELNPKDPDAWLWKGLVLRKLNRNPEAHQALTRSLKLNPARVWAKQQLEKTPEK